MVMASTVPLLLRISPRTAGVVVVIARSCIPCDRYHAASAPCSWTSRPSTSVTTIAIATMVTFSRRTELDRRSGRRDRAASLAVADRTCAAACGGQPPAAGRPGGPGRLWPSGPG